jgi:aldehyde:ferredoxin oxidoreductase
VIRKLEIAEDGTQNIVEVPFKDNEKSAGTLTWIIEKDEEGNILAENASLELEEFDPAEAIMSIKELEERQALLDAGIIGFEESSAPYDWSEDNVFGA